LAKKKSNLHRKLTHDYRLVIMNHGNLEVKLSFKLNRLRVFVLGSVAAFLLIGITILLIIFTPLKEYVPGYSSSKLRKKATNLTYKIDSLEQKIKRNDLYIKGVKALLNGDVKIPDIETTEIVQKNVTEILNLNASHQDSVFRRKVEEEDRFSVFKKIKHTEIVFFSPVKGNVTNVFNSKNKHFAIDIAVEKNTPVKSVADGTVIFTGFIAETGYVMLIEHAQGFLSVYKHNTTLFKEQGDLILSGEVIASSGSTGSLTTGPHLHFELWSNGHPVNPLDFIDFEK